MIQSNDTLRQSWAIKLRQLGMHHFAAAILEGFGPLNFLGAQLIYIGQPVFSSLIPGEHLNELATLLEEPEQVDSFVNILREDHQA